MTNCHNDDFHPKMAEFVNKKELDELDRDESEAYIDPPPVNKENYLDMDKGEDGEESG